MAIASTGNTLGTNVQTSPEERQLKNERKRINGYIRAYQRNPRDWNPSMIASLERLTTQYGIPFQRVVPEATAWENIRGAAVGLADGIAFDFIPDSWYANESNRSVVNAAKTTGAIAPIVASIAAAPFTGGGSLAAAGPSTAKLLGSKALAKGAQKLGAAAAYTPAGQMSKQAIAAGKRAYGSYKGMANTDDILLAVKNNPGELQALVKGKNLSKDQINTIVNTIEGQHGKGAYAKKLIDQVKSGGAKPTDLSSKQIKSMVDEMADPKNADKKLFTKKPVKPKKSSKKDDGGQQTLFDDNKKSPKPKTETVDNLKPIAENANLTSKQIANLAKQLKDGKITTMDEAADWLIQSQKMVQKGGIGQVNYMDAGIALGGGLGSLSPLGGLEPSRAEKEAADLDPYN